MPKGQIEAGRAYGFSGWQCFWLIELPQIWKVAIPGLGNLWQGAVKDTALVSIVGLDDLMRKSNQAAQATREPFTFYFVASLMFLAITLVSMAVHRLARAPGAAAAWRGGSGCRRSSTSCRATGATCLRGTWLTVQLVVISAILGFAARGAAGAGAAVVEPAAAAGRRRPIRCSSAARRSWCRSS